MDKTFKKPQIKWAGPLKGDQFYQTTQTKNNIFLHHTIGGSAKESIDWWNQTPEHVGTPFVIDRDGTIYQCFDEKKWAYSLGVVGATQTEKHGIPIELVSYGFVFDLNPEKGEHTYVAYPLWPLKNGKVSLPEDQVIELDYLNHKYWHKYTDAQISSLIELIQWLIQEYNIPVQENITDFWKFNEAVATKNIPGIWSHTTVRKDKTDIFPQKELVDSLYKAFLKPKK